MSALDYLKNLRETYKREEAEIKEELDSLKEKTEDNTQAIKKLEKSQDSFYESLIPREIHATEKKKLEELSEEQEQMEKRKKELSDRLEILKEKIQELNPIIAEEETHCQTKKEGVWKAEAVLPVQQLENVLHRVELCSRLIDIDPRRCRLEMSTALKMFRDTMEKVKEQGKS